MQGLMPDSSGGFGKIEEIGFPRGFSNFGRNGSRGLESPDARDDSHRHHQADRVQGEAHADKVPKSVAPGAVDDQVGLIGDG